MGTNILEDPVLSVVRTHGTYLANELDGKSVMVCGASGYIGGAILRLFSELQSRNRIRLQVLALSRA